MSKFDVDLKRFAAAMDRCAHDEDFRKRLNSCPADALLEEQIILPSGISVEDFAELACARMTEKMLDCEIPLLPEELEFSDYPSFTNATSRRQKCGLC